MSEQEESLSAIATELHDNLRYIKEYLGDIISGENPLYRIPEKLDDINSNLSEINKTLTYINRHLYNISNKDNEL